MDNTLIASTALGFAIAAFIYGLIANIRLDKMKKKDKKDN